MFPCGQKLPRCLNTSAMLTSWPPVISQCLKRIHASMWITSDVVV